MHFWGYYWAFWVHFNGKKSTYSHVIHLKTLICFCGRTYIQTWRCNSYRIGRVLVRQTACDSFVKIQHFRNKKSSQLCVKILIKQIKTKPSVKQYWKNRLLKLNLYVIFRYYQASTYMVATFLKLNINKSKLFWQ